MKSEQVGKVFTGGGGSGKRETKEEDMEGVRELVEQKQDMGSGGGGVCKGNKKERREGTQDLIEVECLCTSGYHGEKTESDTSTTMETGPASQSIKNWSTGRGSIKSTNTQPRTTTKTAQRKGRNSEGGACTDPTHWNEICGREKNYTGSDNHVEGTGGHDENQESKEHSRKRKTKMVVVQSSDDMVGCITEKATRMCETGGSDKHQLQELLKQAKDHDGRQECDNLFNQENGNQLHGQRGKEFGGSHECHVTLQRAKPKNVSGQSVGKRKDSTAKMHRLADGYDGTEALMGYLRCGYNMEVLKHTTEGMLDPVEKELVGGIDIRGLKAEKESPIGIAQRLLYKESAESEFLKGPPMNAIKGSSLVYKKFSEELISTGLASACNRRKGTQRGYARFFTILKKKGMDGVNLLRTILDCVDANEQFVEPPPVNLPHLPDIQEAFKNCNRIKVLDLRHFFHQIPLGKHLRKWFSIIFGALTLEWNTVPMGWKWACFIAQAISTFAVCKEDAPQWKNLVDIIHTEGIVACVVYDNIMVGGNDEEVEGFWSKLLVNLSELGARIKEQQDSKERGYVENLGLRWYPGGETGLTWEFLEKFQEKVELTSNALAAPEVSTKLIAGALGLCAWHSYATGGHLYDLQMYYKQLGEWVSKFGWRGGHTKEVWIDNLRSHLLTRCEETGRYGHKKVDKWSCICTDASLKGYGGVDVYTHAQVSGVWGRLHDSADIFYLEALAVKIVVKALVPKGEGALVMTDNKALSYALKRKTTSCPRTARILKQIHETCKVSVVWIPTDRNPADELSRGKDVRGDKVDWIIQEWDEIVPTSVWGAKVGVGGRAPPH